MRLILQLECRRFNLGKVVMYGNPVKLSAKVRVKDYRFHHWDYGCFIMLISEEDKEHMIHSPRPTQQTV